LSRHGIKGTFYLAKRLRPNRLSDDDIRRLAATQEIGAHTLTHPDLRELSPEKQREEIAGSKKWLEELLCAEVKMFCYPKGFYTNESVELVKEAGFLGARTTKLCAIVSDEDPFLLPTTLQVYPFPFRKLTENTYYWGRLLEPYRQRAPMLNQIGVSILSMYSWLSMAKKNF